MRWRSLLAWLVLAAWPMSAGAEHANIDLRILSLDPSSGKTQAEARAAADQEPPAGGINPRPLLKVRANQPLVLQFILVNTYPHGNNPDVTVRYFVVREDKPRQKTVPDLSRGLVTQGRFKMSFKPKCRVGARLAFTIKDPGVYLLRVETANTSRDHEHFSAIDIQVE